MPARRLTAALALLPLAAASCGEGAGSSSTAASAPARAVVATPSGRPMVQLLRIGLNEATRDRVRVYANGRATVLLGHGGGGQTLAQLVYTRRGFVRLHAVLRRTSMTHPGRAGANPGVWRGGIYLYILRYRGREVRGVRNAEPPHVRAAIRALDELADGGGPVRKLTDARTGPAPNH